MPQPGGLAVEGRPHIVRPAGLYPAAVGASDNLWAQLAGHLQVEGFCPVVVLRPPETDVYRPSASALRTEMFHPLSPAAAETATPRKVYRLGSVAVEAAGIERADHLAGEAETRARYQRFLAGVAMHNTVRQAPDAPKTAYRSSLDLLRDAAAGKAESRKALLLDAKTHVYEVYGGVGERMEVRLELNEEKKVAWAGQTNEARQFHTLTSFPSQSAAMLAVQHAEGLDSFRQEDRNRDGSLRGKVVFDFSAMANASRDELDGMGYFLNSIAVCIRRNRFTENECEVASVFVAGVDQRKFKPQRDETEAQEVARQTAALAERFDIRVLRKMYRLFKVEGADTMGPAELLATQIVAPEEFDEIDMAMLYDQLAAEELEPGVQTFFGSVELWQQIGAPHILTREHYDNYVAQSQQRQQEYDALCEEIVTEQVALSGTVHTPLEAAEMKRQVVLRKTVAHAARDNRIDPDRFGREAARCLNAARERYTVGDDTGGDQLVKQAQEKARDPACPPGMRNKFGLEADQKDDKKEDGCKEVNDGDSVHCPYCDQDVKARVPVKGGRIYCSNKRCSAAYQKESVQEKLFARKKNNAPKPRFFTPVGSNKPTNKPKNDPKT